MRRRTILLLFVLTFAATAAFFGAYASTAGALAFTDGPCYPDANNIKACPSGFTGTPYNLQLLGRAGTGCYPNVTFSLLNTSLPPGLTMSSSGLISGTPTTAGKYYFWVSMKDTFGNPSWCTDNESTERQFSINILQGLHIQYTSANLPAAQLNTNYNFQFTTSGGGSPTFAVSSGALPAGISLTSAGLLSGTATTAGDYHFKVKAVDGERSDTQTYTLSVVPQLKITSPAATAAEIGRPFRFTLTAEGGRTAYSWSATGLPTGLNLDGATGAITGTPTTAGLASVQVTLKDSLGLTQTVDLKLAVAAQLQLVKRALPSGKAGRAYHARLYVSGGVSPKRWTIIGGVLPAGIHLNSRTGALTGTPTHAGTSHIYVSVRDKLGAVSRARFTIKVG